jgi:transcriptional accessory protein Tex/SPT6
MALKDWKKSSLGWINSIKKQELNYLPYKKKWEDGTIAIIELEDISEGRKGLAESMWEKKFQSKSQALAFANNYMKNN